MASNFEDQERLLTSIMLTVTYGSLTVIYTNIIITTRFAAYIIAKFGIPIVGVVTIFFLFIPVILAFKFFVIFLNYLWNELWRDFTEHSPTSGAVLSIFSFIGMVLFIVTITAFVALQSNAYLQSISPSVQDTLNSILPDYKALSSRFN